MKTLIAVDSFKGTLTSREVAETIRDNVETSNNFIDIIAVADGGEGTVDSLMYATKGRKVTINVQNAYGDIQESYYCLADNDETAIVEIALSSGLSIMENMELNPLKTTTYGLGETINDALTYNIKKLVIGIGGSSSNDGGAGMLQALGVKFYNNENELIKVMNGESIGSVSRIDASVINEKFKGVYIEVACDVNNPLLGEKGCTYIYGPQKGATKEMLPILEENMRKFSEVVAKTINKDNSKIPGVGAAGGLGFGLTSFLHADLLSGLDVVADATKLEERIQLVDLVITGEGAFDTQSLNGKAPTRIARLARKHNKKVVGVFAFSTLREFPELFDEIHTICPTISKEESMKYPKESLSKLINSIKHKL